MIGLKCTMPFEKGTKKQCVFPLNDRALTLPRSICGGRSSQYPAGQNGIRGTQTTTTTTATTTAHTIATGWRTTSDLITFQNQNGSLIGKKYEQRTWCNKQKLELYATGGSDRDDIGNALSVGEDGGETTNTDEKTLRWYKKKVCDLRDRVRLNVYCKVSWRLDHCKANNERR